VANFSGDISPHIVTPTLFGTTTAVTTDANAFLAADYNFTAPTLIKMTAHLDALGATFWVTDFADVWNTLFPSTMSGYSNALYTYHTAGNSGLITEIRDFGLSLTGDWYGSLPHSDLSGTADVLMELNNAGGDAAKTVTAASNATPIVITAAAHGYSDQDEVVIAGVTGNTAANGRWKLTVVDANNFRLLNFDASNSTGNGAYVSGGTAVRWVWVPSGCWPSWQPHPPPAWPPRQSPEPSTRHQPQPSRRW
jgi:hypothetical protein